MAKVSIVIPAFNAARYIKRTVESVLAQTYRDFEILVVDDGSSDSSILELEPLLSNKATRVIRQNNGGPSLARNRGIMESKGDLIAFLDSDDIYLENKIEESIKVFDLNPNVDILYSNEIFFLEESPGRHVESPHPKFSGDIFFYLKRSNFIHTSTVMARRWVFERWQFDTNLRGLEDWDLFLKISKEGIKFHYIPKALVRVRLSREGLTNTTKEWDELRRVVGERARAHWRDLKKSDYARCVRLKAKAALIGFPRHERFNKSMPHDLLKTK